MNSIRITVLVENTAQGRGLLGEHGLSFWIEIGRKRVLFDTGQTDLIRHNSRRLNIDLADAESIILSHGHYDHTGGLAAVLEQTGWMNVYLHPDALGPKYGRNTDGTARNLGIPRRSRDALDAVCNKVFTEEPAEVCSGLWCTGSIPRITDFEDTGGPFFTDDQCRQADELRDDQAAFIDTSDGVTVILGCAHAGVVNTLHYVRKMLPMRPISTVIGGTHLIAADEQRMRRTIDSLREFGVQRLYPLHCTGFRAAAQLWRYFSDRVALCPVGTQVELT